MNYALTAGAIASITLSMMACSPAPGSFDQAKNVFDDHRPALEDVIERLGRCSPITGGGEEEAYADISADTSKNVGVRCETGADAQIGEIAALLRPLHILGVSYGGKNNSGQVEKAEFELLDDETQWAKIGYTLSGLTQPEFSEENADHSALEQTKALTGPPYHWFWKSHKT